MVRRAGVDRIHSHFANSGATVAMLAAQLLGLPWSLTLHGISETDPPAGGLLAEKIERADFVACASWFMQAQGMRLVSAELWPKFHVVRCGVELGRLEVPAAAEFSSRLRFVTVGRISAEKGYPGLIEAFTGLIDGGIDAELAVVGDGPLREALQRQIKCSGVADRVTMHGILPETDTLRTIARADVFVLSSLMEGLPVALMEAMALGKPVIAAFVAGIPELVRHGEAGLLYRPGDWSNLGQCMYQIAADSELRLRLSRASRSCIEQEYEIDRAVRPLATLFGFSGSSNVEKVQCSRA
jgi:glycosyltransferase involved in cell wall biosynthesis